MQITIDTKKDSPEEIKKAIHLLSVLVQGRVKSSNIFEDENTPPPRPDPTSGSSGNAFANMFGGTPPPAPDPKTQDDDEDNTELMTY